MQTATLEKPGPAKPGRGGRPLGVRQDAFEGRFRPITAHQLCLVWWLHSARHITRRQLRVWFSAHEMHERRRYTIENKQGGGKGKKRIPLYTLEELKTLVGGRGSATADAELRADISRLAKLGLVQIGDQAITFAASIDQIALDDVSGFWAMFDRIPNPGRTVPVPRRTLRALAGGFSRAVTGVMIALMIRSLFWHRETEDYRVDGRTKGSWITEVFGVSRRAVTDARTHLIELGWLEPVPTAQWALNRWGAHDRIRPEWTRAAQVKDGAGEGREGTGEERVAAGGFASPVSDNPTVSATPCLNSPSFPSERNLITRKSDPAQPEAWNFKITEGSRKKKAEEGKHPADLRDIHPNHLKSTEDVLALYRQAVERKLARDGDAGRLDFMALVERARVRGRRPGALLAWLLREQRFDFITQADEDAAVERWRAYRNQAYANGAAARTTVGRDPADRPVPKPREWILSDDDKLVRACLLTAKNHLGLDPFLIAHKIKQWTREQWEEALLAYEQAELDRWRQPEGGLERPWSGI